MSTETAQTTETTPTTQTTNPATGKTYTEAEVEALVSGRIAAAVGAATNKTKKDLESELAALREKANKYEQKELEEKGRYAESLKLQEKSLLEKFEPQLKERDEKIQALTGIVRDRTVKAVLVNAAAALNAVNPQEIARLLDPEIALDESFTPSVMDGKAQRFVDGKPMTPEQRVAEYLKANPHHVRAAQTAPGGGAGGGATRSGTEAGEIEILTKQAADLEKRYRETRDPNVLTQHREVINKLRAAKHRAA